jgi:hypothetical protein
MIQVHLPGGNDYVLMALSVLCLTTLFTWIAALCSSAGARLWVAYHRRAAIALLLALALPGAIFPVRRFMDWRQARAQEADLVARSLTLQAASNVDGAQLPEGSKLLLARAGDLSTYEKAEFPRPTAVYGLQIMGLARYRHRSGDSLPAGSNDVSAVLAEDQIVDGWRCSRRHNVELIVPKAMPPRFRSCNLGEGNTLEQRPIPAGAWVAASPTPSGARGWLLRVDGRDAITFATLSLIKAEARIDENRQVLGFQGQLAVETVLGPMTYPSGTGVRAASPGVAGAIAGDLIFSPSRGRSAQRKQGESVSSGSSVLQGPDGTVRSVQSNRSLGVLDVADL